MKTKKQEYFSKSTLKIRGWTEKAIELFLKQHDKEGRNPYYRTASPTKLYLITRVEDQEKTKEFKEFKEKNKKRKDGSQQAVITKKENMYNYVNNINIDLQKEDYNIILKEAINSYNDFKQEIVWDNVDYDFQKATINSNKEFLKRIIVNYLRHQLTNYDMEIETIFGKVGKNEAYKILNKKVYNKIAEIYPSLKEECNRQLSEKSNETDYLL